MSGLPFEILLALRYLRPKRTFVSVITLISVAGVALGVAVLIVVISVMSGFDKQLRDTILGFNAHLKIYKPNVGIVDYPHLMSQVASNKNVKGVAPYIISQVLMETTTNDHSSQVWDTAPYVRGIDPAAETNVTTLATNIADGKFDVSGHGILIGSVLATEYGIQVGDTVNISSPEDVRKMRESYQKGHQEAIPPMEYEVRGIFDVGFYDFNATTVVISLANAQDMSALGDRVQGLMVVLDDPFNAMLVRDELKKTLGPDYRITTWLEESSMLGAVAVEKNVMFIILFCIMIVAALCILSALITFVVQKTREIGMLKALGATDFQVGGLFLSQSAFIGTVGVLAGLGIGFLALAYRNEFLHFMRWATGMPLFPADIYQFNQLPAIIVPRDIIIICGSAFVICILGGV
ncbi:MAG TPA: ABC transporter permease, partial [Candidatus Polarisedimenticolia bacterium]|nr:ABC transporter permease [Candidatus Polarisedimenticolia bacterium]